MRIAEVNKPTYIIGYIATFVGYTYLSMLRILLICTYTCEEQPGQVSYLYF